MVRMHAHHVLKCASLVAFHAEEGPGIDPHSLLNLPGLVEARYQQSGPGIAPGDCRSGRLHTAHGAGNKGYEKLLKARQVMHVTFD
jgi:hypothetical protein